MDGSGRGGILQKMVVELQEQCAARGSDLSERLLVLMLKSVLSDPTNGFNADQGLTEEDLLKVEELCLNKLTEKCSPSMDTMRMQEYFRSYTSRGQLLEEVRQDVEQRLSPLRREITGSRLKTREALDALYSKMVSYILQPSNLGSPADANHTAQVKAALQSVFPHAELGAFTTLSTKEKVEQLDELTGIVTGICLFNERQQTEPHHPMTFKDIEAELSASQCLAWKYTALLEKLMTTGAGVSVELLKRALYNVRQHEAFLQILLSHARLCAERAGDLRKELLTQKSLLKEHVKAKLTVNTSQVFPLFQTLSHLWRGLQEEAELLGVVRGVTLKLRPFVASQAELFPDAHLDRWLEGWEVKTDEERRRTRPSEERLVLAEMTSCEWLQPETHVGELQLRGFCGSTIENRDGLLLPGDPQLGVLKHKGKFYTFSSQEAALRFASRPERSIAAVEERARRSPELLHLLGLQQQDTGFETWAVKPTTKCESGTQTDLHPVAANVVADYEWNEWALRKNAIQMSHLLSKATHSAQTQLSTMRRESATQVWLPKDAASQCRRDGQSNVARPQVYLTGLRGRRDGPLVKTDLTRPVDQ